MIRHILTRDRLRSITRTDLRKGTGVGRMLISRENRKKEERPTMTRFEIMDRELTQQGLRRRGA